MENFERLSRPYAKKSWTDEKKVEEDFAKCEGLLREIGWYCRLDGRDIIKNRILKPFEEGVRGRDIQEKAKARITKLLDSIYSEAAEIRRLAKDAWVCCPAERVTEAADRGYMSAGTAKKSDEASHAGTC